MRGKCLWVNRTARIRHQCRKTIVISCNRCLVYTGVEKMNQHINIDLDFDHQMSLSLSKCGYSNNCLHFLKARCSISLHQLLNRGGEGWGGVEWGWDGMGWTRYGLPVKPWINKVRGECHQSQHIVMQYYHCFIFVKIEKNMVITW